MDKTRLWYIRTNKIFSGLSEKEMGEIASKLTERHVRKRGLVYNPGDKAETVYILKEGRVRITQFFADGKEFTVDILEPGDIFGELTTAEEELRGTSAEAMEDSYICVIKRKDFEVFIGSIPDLSFAVTKWISRRLSRVESRFMDMLFQDVRSRLLTIFKYLARKYGAPVDGGSRIEIHLSHKEIASLIGAARETVTLELNNLKRSGDVIMDGKYFVLPSKHIS